MGEKAEAFGEGALVVGGFVVGAIFFVAMISVVFPVAKTHCLVPDDQTPQVESGWKFSWEAGGFPNPAPDGVEPDGKACVRNSPARETLSAVGIWELGSPEHQVASNVLE